MSAIKIDWKRPKIDKKKLKCYENIISLLELDCRRLKEEILQGRSPLALVGDPQLNIGKRLEYVRKEIVEYEEAFRWRKCRTHPIWLRDSLNNISKLSKESLDNAKLSARIKEYLEHKEDSIEVLLSFLFRSGEYLASVNEDGVYGDKKYVYFAEEIWSDGSGGYELRGDGPELILDQVHFMDFNTKVPLIIIRLNLLGLEADISPSLTSSYYFKVQIRPKLKEKTEIPESD
jgi:hypothetical protein